MSGNSLLGTTADLLNGGGANNAPNGSSVSPDTPLATVLGPILASDPAGLLAGLTVADVGSLNLSLLGPTLAHVAASLDGDPLTLPSHVTLAGLLGTEGADVVHLAADTVLGSAVLGGGDDVLSAPSTAITTGTIDGGAGADALTLGTGNATVLGGAGDDRIMALGAGDNRLDGGDGADSMAGGAGNDTYVVDNPGDEVTERSGQGTDTVEAWISYALTDNVEKLVLQGHDAIDGTGNGLDNVITGNDAANILDGGEGSDTLIGGLGDDTYVVRSSGDIIVEGANGGTDTVQSASTYSLAGTNLENLTLTGSDAINGTGNEANNILMGNAGANILDGGAGSDTMIGGNGNDTYYVNDVNDKVIEYGNGGDDIVYSSVSYVAAGTYVEAVTLTGHAANDVCGNGLDNILTGNDAANLMNGSRGADTMIGGAGSDTYIVDNVGDHVVEQAGGGLDLVKASVDFTLSDNVERLTLTGLNPINGTGNAMDNVIAGNTAANVIDGGLGADTMIGGQGDDTYFVDNFGDKVIEAKGQGTDLVNSSISYTLTSLALENLTLTGSSAINGTGNDVNNVLHGNDGANTLLGLRGADVIDGGAGDDVIAGGTGQDIVTGGLGADRFVFNAGELAGRTHDTADTITDFSHDQGDRIDLSGLDADTTHAGDQAFTFIGDAPFTAAGQVRFEHVDGNTYLLANVDNNLGADIMIKLGGLHDLVAADLLL